MSTKTIPQLDVNPGLLPAALLEVSQSGSSYKSTVQDVLDLIIVANVGAGATIFRDETPANTFNLKTIIGGTNITVDNNANDITINATGTGITSLNADATAAQVIAGTAARISLVDAGALHTFDIDVAYVGQASITTLGTIVTGVWNGTGITYANLDLTLGIVNGDISASAAIVLSKLENLLSGRIIVGSATNIPTAVVMGGDASISNTGVVTVSLAATVTTNANLTGGVTSIGNAATVITNANLTGDVTSVGNATTVVTNANLTGGVTSVGNAATVITNANLTGDVTSIGNATTIAAGAVDIAMLSATGTPDGTNFLRGDNTWAVPAGSGDMVLASAQTNTGIKTFLDTTMKLRNVLNTFDAYFVNSVTIDRIFTLPDAAGTVVITGLANQLTNTELTAGAFGKITGVGVLTTGTWNAVDIVFANLQQIATDRLVGRDTAATGDMEELTVAGGVEFTGAGGIQTSALTGDVTKAAGGTVTTIAAGSVDIAMLSASGTPDATTFLRGDNTWAVPAGGSTTLAALTDVTITTRAANEVLVVNPGNTLWVNALLIDANIGAAAAIAFSKLATLTSGSILVGSAGNVVTSVAMSGDIGIIASGLTTIQVDAVDIAMLSATGVADSTTFLRGDNTWSAPAGSGDMVLATAQTSTGKKTFAADATNAGFNLNNQVPTATVAGDIWRSTDNLVMRNNTDTADITLFSTANRQTAIVDSEIDAAAAIAFSKLASLASGNILVGSVGTVATSVVMGGDVSIIAAGTTTIAAGVVTLAKMANINTARFLGRVTGGVGTPEQLTGTQATTLLDNFTAALKGLVPLSGGGTTNFLRADGTWAPPGGASPLTTKGDVYTYTTVDARLGVGTDGFVLSADSAEVTGLKWIAAGVGDMILGTPQVVTGAKTFGTVGGAVGKLILAGSTSGTSILNAAAVAGTTTITLPGVTDTLAVLGANTFTASQSLGGNNLTNVGDITTITSLNGVLIGNYVLTTDASTVLADTLNITYLNQTNTYTGSNGQAFGTNWLTFGSNPADAGAIRLSNADIIAWEASPVGIDGVFTFSASEIFTLSHKLNITGALSLTPAIDVSPLLELIQSVTTPTDNTEIANINYTSETDTTSDVIFAQIKGETADVTNATSSGKLLFYVRDTNSIVSPYMYLDGNLQKIFYNESVDITGTLIVSSTINKVTVTPPTTSATLTLSDLSSLITVGGDSLTLTTSATTNATFPAGTITLVDVGTPQSISGVKTMNALNVITHSSTGLMVRNSGNTFNYTIAGGATGAAQTITLPAVTGADTFAVLGLAQTFTATQTLNSFKGTGAVTVTNIIDDDTMATASNTTLATSESIKAYVDATGGASPLTTKGDVYTYTTVDARLGVGTDGFVLSADSVEATGLKWIAAGAGDMLLGTPQTVTGAKTFGGVGAVGKFILAGNTSGTTIVNAAAVAGTTTITLPGVTDTLAVLGTAQTFTAAQTFNDTTLILAGATSGTTTLKAAAVAGTTIATLPDSTGTIAYKTGIDSPKQSFIIAISDETTAITTGLAKATFRVPAAFTVTEVRASLTTVSSSGLPTFDINENGTTILSTKITIDVSEKTSETAVTPPVISDAVLADDAEITIDIDTAGTGAAGAKIYIIGYYT